MKNTTWKEVAIPLLESGLYKYSEIAEKVKKSEISVQKLASEKKITIKQVRQKNRQMVNQNIVEEKTKKEIEDMFKNQKTIANKKIGEFQKEIGEKFNVYLPGLPSNEHLGAIKLTDPGTYISEYFVDQTVAEIIGEEKSFFRLQIPRGKRDKDVFVLTNSDSNEVWLIEKVA